MLLQVCHHLTSQQMWLHCPRLHRYPICQIYFTRACLNTYALESTHTFVVLQLTCLVLRNEHIYLLKPKSIWSADETQEKRPLVERILQLDPIEVSTDKLHFFGMWCFIFDQGIHKQHLLLMPLSGNISLLPYSLCYL